MCVVLHNNFLLHNCSVAAKVNQPKRTFYYAFLVHDPEIRTEPVPVLQLLTDEPDEECLPSMIKLFMRDKRKRHYKKR